MGLKNYDIKIVNYIDYRLHDYYSKTIYEICQKTIFTKQKQKIKSEEFLRHVRNIIAHVNFTMVGNLLIGFDLHKGKIKAIIKINPGMLLNAIKKLNSGITQEKIWTYSFEKLGYKIEHNLGKRII